MPLVESWGFVVLKVLTRHWLHVTIITKCMAHISQSMANVLTLCSGIIPMGGWRCAILTVQMVVQMSHFGSLNNWWPSNSRTSDAQKLHWFCKYWTELYNFIHHMSQDSKTWARSTYDYVKCIVDHKWCMPTCFHDSFALLDTVLSVHLYTQVT